MTPAFAQELAELRLRQTAGLVEWMVENCPDPEAADRALAAVNAAHAAIEGLDFENSRGVRS